MTVPTVDSDRSAKIALIGGGPAALVAAIALARRGVRTRRSSSGPPYCACSSNRCCFGPNSIVLYEDRLSDAIPEELWNSKSAALQDELRRARTEMERHARLRTIRVESRRRFRVRIALEH